MLGDVQFPETKDSSRSVKISYWDYEVPFGTMFVDDLEGGSKDVVFHLPPFCSPVFSPGKFTELKENPDEGL